jgi:hypothetical protein
MAFGVTAAQADCKCLNRGVEVVEGNTACIKTANGGQMALCEKNLNVTNWKFLGEECPVASTEAAPTGVVSIALLPTN